MQSQQRKKSLKAGVRVLLKLSFETALASWERVGVIFAKTWSQMPPWPFMNFYLFSFEDICGVYCRRFLHSQTNKKQQSFFPCPNHIYIYIQTRV